jgi:hypothetical protein
MFWFLSSRPKNLQVHFGVYGDPSLDIVSSAITGIIIAIFSYETETEDTRSGASL